MKRSNYTLKLSELSESEGVFTTAQAARLGIPRDALHDAAESGRLVRVTRGAYRLAGSQTAYTDELVAIWKMTAPGAFTHERMQTPAWDGVAVGGSTAASVLGLGDFYLSPYRIYSRKRFNTRNAVAHFGIRSVSRDEVLFVGGVPVTCAERTIFDLVVDGEDLSLVADALRDACRDGKRFDLAKLKGLLDSKFRPRMSALVYDSLLSEADVSGEGRAR